MFMIINKRLLRRHLSPLRKGLRRAGLGLWVQLMTGPPVPGLAHLAPAVAPARGHQAVGQTVTHGLPAEEVAGVVPLA